MSCLLRRHRLGAGWWHFCSRMKTTGPQQEQQHARPQRPRAARPDSPAPRTGRGGGGCGMAAEGRGGCYGERDSGWQFAVAPRDRAGLFQRGWPPPCCPAALEGGEIHAKRGAVATSLNVMLLPPPSMALFWMTTEGGSSSSTSMTRDSWLPSPEWGFQGIADRRGRAAPAVTGLVRRPHCRC